MSVGLAIGADTLQLPADGLTVVVLGEVVEQDVALDGVIGQIDAPHLGVETEGRHDKQRVGMGRMGHHGGVTVVALQGVGLVDVQVEAHGVGSGKQGGRDALGRGVPMVEALCLCLAEEAEPRAGGSIGCRGSLGQITG